MQKNNRAPFVIGLTGLARSGKDTFCSILIKELSKIGIRAERLSLADALKYDLSYFVKSKTGLNIFTDNSKEKELLRPLMIAYGSMLQRNLSQGQHWTRILQPQVESLLKNKISVIVTDIRFSFFPKDEDYWLKQNNGILVHISKYKLENGQKIYDTPPNELEAENDPKLKSKSDYLVEWPESDKNDLYKNCAPHVLGFLEWLKNS